jgi:hypothetical protein
MSDRVRPYRRPVRWDDLFLDLTGQALAAADATLVADSAEHARTLVARQRLLDQLRSAGARPVRLGLVADGEHVEGRPLAVGADWLSLAGPHGEVLVPEAALAFVRYLPGASSSAEFRSLDQPLLSRTPLSQAVRRLARDRAVVHVLGAGGLRLVGTIDRAGLDHLALAEHPEDEPRRRTSVRGTTLVPYSTVLCIRGGSVWGR